MLGIKHFVFEWRQVVFLIAIVCSLNIAFGLEKQQDDNDEVLVNMPVGRVRGRRLQGPDNGTVDVFWGIPYARPPLGALRFARPLPVDPWLHVRDATTVPNSCQQIGKSSSYTLLTPVSEDCLYLNVFAPTVSAPIGATPKHVMVFVHGGGLTRGTSATEKFNATTLAAVNDVIVVTLNYRVGAFGFLYSATEDAPGNAGLLDQLLAIRFVRDNVAHFGGDPTSITLFGESVGSASISLMLLSPLVSGDLFRRAILSSGSPMADRFVYSREAAIGATLKVSELTGCNSSADVGEAVACLKLLPEEALDAAQERVAKFGVVVDGQFLPDKPRALYGNAAAKNVSVFMGMVRDEGNFFLPAIYGDLVSGTSSNQSLTLAQLNGVIERVAAAVAHNVVGESQRLLLTQQYTNWEDLENGVKNLKMAGLVVGDNYIFCPVSDFATGLSALGIDVRVYLFNHRASVIRRPRWTGIVHGDDMDFIFGKPLRDNTYRKIEIELSRRVMKHFVAFAKTGNPAFDTFEWPKFSNLHRDLVILDTKAPRLVKEPRANACALRRVTMPKLTSLLAADLSKTTGT